jgi:hypothetical protein
MATTDRVHTAYDPYGRRWQVRLEVTYGADSANTSLILVCECGWKKNFFWASGKTAAMEHLAQRHHANRDQRTEKF